MGQEQCLALLWRRDSEQSLSLIWNPTFQLECLPERHLGTVVCSEGGWRDAWYDWLWERAGGNRKGSRWQLMQCTRCTLCAAPLVATPWEVDAWCQEVRRVNLFKRCSKHCKGHALILGSINFWLDQVSVFGRVFFRYCLQIMCEWWVGSHKWEEASPTPKHWFLTCKYRIE